MHPERRPPGRRDTVRAFVAVELPDAWREALADTQEALRAAGLGRLRWVRPEGIHLTLKFLGEIETSRVAAVTEAMTAAAAASATFTLAGGGLGTFGPPARPRVLWAGVSGGLDDLTGLWRAVDERVSALGFSHERERFSPHLTLARVPDHLSAEEASRIIPALRGARAPAFAPFEVAELVLMRSELGPGGARHTRLAAARLFTNP